MAKRLLLTSSSTSISSNNELSIVRLKPNGKLMDLPKSVHQQYILFYMTLPQRIKMQRVSKYWAKIVVEPPWNKVAYETYCIHVPNFIHLEFICLRKFKLHHLSLFCAPACNMYSENRIMFINMYNDILESQVNNLRSLSLKDPYNQEHLISRMGSTLEHLALLCSGHYISHQITPFTSNCLLSLTRLTSLVFVERVESASLNKSHITLPLPLLPSIHTLGLGSYRMEVITEFIGNGNLPNIHTLTLDLEPLELIRMNRIIDIINNNLPLLNHLTLDMSADDFSQLQHPLVNLKNPNIVKSITLNSFEIEREAEANGNFIWINSTLRPITLLFEELSELRLRHYVVNNEFDIISDGIKRFKSLTSGRINIAIKELGFSYRFVGAVINYLTGNGKWPITIDFKKWLCKWKSFKEGLELLKQTINITAVIFCNLKYDPDDRQYHYIHFQQLSLYLKCHSIKHQCHCGYKNDICSKLYELI